MNNTFPFSFVQSLAERFKPPVWVVDETQKRLVLFLNHVLMQEKEAQDRLMRKKAACCTCAGACSDLICW
jgi:ubiquinone biosynthesis protein UbiJ